MKPLCTWNHRDDKLRWIGKPKPHRSAIWRVEMWVKRGNEKATREVIPSAPIRLGELLEGVLHEQVDELLAELPGPDNMGFSVYLWR